MCWGTETATVSGRELGFRWGLRHISYNNILDSDGAYAASVPVVVASLGLVVAPWQHRSLRPAELRYDVGGGTFGRITAVRRAPKSREWKKDGRALWLKRRSTASASMSLRRSRRGHSAIRSACSHSDTRSSNRQTRHKDQRLKCPAPRTLDPGPWTLAPGPRTLDPEP